MPFDCASSYSLLFLLLLSFLNLSSDNPEENWTVFQKVVHSSAATTIGHPYRKHQDWFDENDEEIKLLLEKKTLIAQGTSR